MTITLSIEGDLAVFKYPPEYDEMDEELDGLLDRWRAGRIPKTGYVRALEDLVARHPRFIDGHAHLGNPLWDHGKIGQRWSATSVAVRWGRSFSRRVSRHSWNGVSWKTARSCARLTAWSSAILG